LFEDKGFFIPCLSLSYSLIYDPNSPRSGSDEFSLFEQPSKGALLLLPEFTSDFERIADNGDPFSLIIYCSSFFGFFVSSVIDYNLELRTNTILLLDLSWSGTLSKSSLFF
jgi:hypothetical protein